DRNRSHWSTSKTPSYTKSVSWQHHQNFNIFKQIHLHDDPPPTSSSLHIITNLITVMKVLLIF
ncbi:hypothetical protein, partial [Escherichia coli]|uniref:hypothetical protein n=1 Tax=Escherichia coli TaxID=562 RepID=UPI0023405014